MKRTQAKPVRSKRCLEYLSHPRFTYSFISGYIILTYFYLEVSKCADWLKPLITFSILRTTFAVGYGFKPTSKLSLMYKMHLEMNRELL